MGRARIAAKQNARYRKAVEACGSGHADYGARIISDRAGLETDQIIYRYRDHGTGWIEIGERDYDVRNPELAMPIGPWASPIEAYGFTVEKDTPFGVFKAGTYYRVCRYETRCVVFELYNPLSQEQLDERRERREAEKVAAEMADRPLFADQIRAEAYPLKAAGKAHRAAQALIKALDEIEQENETPRKK